METQIKLIDKIKNSVILEANYKIELIKNIEMYDANTLANLDKFFDLEQEYIALDSEGITAKIDEIIAEFNK